MDIKSLIQEIRKRPGIFLGCEKITPLWHFLNGYQLAKHESNNGVKNNIIPLDFYYFSAYISIKTNTCNNAGWCYNILNYCNGDEHRALNCFFDFYDEFCEVKAEYFIKSVLTQENISCNNNMEHAYQVINDPKSPISVCIIKPTPTQENISCNNMECAYQEIKKQKAPIYTDPISVYIIKLNFSAYLIAVETQKNILCEKRLFTSLEKVMKELSPYFGKIELGNKNTELIKFEKNIIIE